MPRYEADTLREAISKAVYGENYEWKKGKKPSRYLGGGKPVHQVGKPDDAKLRRILSDCATRRRCSRTLRGAIREAAESVRNLERNSGRGSRHHAALVYQDLFGNYTWTLPNDRIGSSSGALLEDVAAYAHAYVKGQGYAGRRAFEASLMARTRVPPAWFRVDVSRLAAVTSVSDFKGYWVTHNTNHAAERADRHRESVFEVSRSGSARLWS